jgi:4-hydroxy-2-oxoheptanedioate aldolase
MSPQPWTALRRRMSEGRVVGTFQKLASLEVVDILADHFDFVVVDLEHSQIDDLSARQLIRHARALEFPVMVRVATPDRERVNRLLEAGATGIQLSTVTRADSVGELRASMRYAPHGNRSISLVQPSGGYGASGLREFLDAQEDGPLLVAQIETAVTDDPLDEIAAARPDVLFIGPTDLTVDLGHDTDSVARRIGEIADVAERAGIPLGGTTLDGVPLRYELAGSDLGALRSAIGLLTGKGG